MGDMMKAVFDKLDELAEVNPDTLIALRRAMYEDGRIDANEARKLLIMHREGRGKGAGEGWADFLVEALADHFALQREAPSFDTTFKADYVQSLKNVARAASPFSWCKTVERDETWAAGEMRAVGSAEVAALIEAFEQEGGLVLDPVERRVLMRLFDRAVSYPKALTRFALEAVYETVRADGLVDGDEVELLRRVLYGPAGDEGIVISRDEAELLLAMRTITCDADNAETWPELFAKAVGCHVLMGGAAIDEVDQGESQWLIERLGDPKTLDVAGRRLLSHLAREARQVAPEFENYAFAA
ncbi:MAG: hypothetical protein PVI23_00040 [Maricaulaceae bacterium]|jgi:hypothetical protein